MLADVDSLERNTSGMFTEIYNKKDLYVQKFFNKKETANLEALTTQTMAKFKSANHSLQDKRKCIVYWAQSHLALQ
ncbi:hypothetical protein SAMN04488084_101667 [Pedobacter antarcticus]|nr:hypothetical protein SAMN04488084_101667 [Pedobacter antarcticus]